MKQDKQASSGSWMGRAFNSILGKESTHESKAGAMIDENSRDILKRNEMPVANIYFKMMHRDHSDQLKGLASFENKQLPQKF